MFVVLMDPHSGSKSTELLQARSKTRPSGVLPFISAGPEVAPVRHRRLGGSHWLDHCELLPSGRRPLCFDICWFLGFLVVVYSPANRTALLMQHDPRDETLGMELMTALFQSQYLLLLGCRWRRYRSLIDSVLVAQSGRLRW